MPLKKRRLNLAVTVYQPAAGSTPKILFADLKGKVHFEAQIQRIELKRFSGPAKCQENEGRCVG